MTSSLNQKRRAIHQSVITKISDGLATVSAFFLIFSVLMTASNWPAYSRILQDIIDPTAMEQMAPASLFEEIEARPDVNSPSLEELAKDPETSFSLAMLGDLYPEDMYLEVPKVFDGAIPVKTVDEADFDFKDLYESENTIQEALREGVVHYPYTANPDQFGNVFITGHSSYYPWDEGKYKDIFALLHKLEPGDEYFITYKGDRYTYRVKESFEVQPDDVSVLEQPIDQKISTLMTCTPVGTVLRRLIVRADLVAID